MVAHRSSTRLRRPARPHSLSPVKPNTRQDSRGPDRKWPLPDPTWQRDRLTATTAPSHRDAVGISAVPQTAIAGDPARPPSHRNSDSQTQPDGHQGIAVQPSSQRLPLRLIFRPPYPQSRPKRGRLEGARQQCPLLSTLAAPRMVTQATSLPVPARACRIRHPRETVAQAPWQSQ